MSGRLAIALAAVAVALACASPPASAWTSSCCLPWQQPAQVAISPDGRFAYASGHDVALFLARDPGTGALSVVDSYDADGGGTTELSPDGRSLYIVSTTGGDIAELRRDEASGALTSIGNYTTDPNRSYSRYRDIAFTSDSRTAYVTDSSIIETVDRDPASGVLAYRSTLRPGDAAAPDLHSPMALELSQDDKFVYVLQGRDKPLLVLARLADGSLSEVQAVPVDPEATDIALAPNGRRLYAGPSGPISFDRDPATGMLTQTEQGAVGASSVEAVSDGQMLPTPDGSGLYVLDNGGSRLYEYATTDHGVRFVKTYRENADGQGLLHPGGLSMSPDGGFVYVGSGPAWGLKQPGRIGVFRRDPATNHLSFASLYTGPVFNGHAPWDTPPASVAIDDGAQFTNDPDVTLTVEGFSWPSSFVMRFSNDGGFGPGTAEDVPVLERGHRYPWRLATSGPERLAKTVYVRGFLAGTEQVVTDDILLDQRPPEVAAVDVAGGSVVRVRARDSLSGVKRIQVTRNRSKPGPWRPYRSRTRYRIGRRPLYVRVRDGAGNHSKWHRVKASPR
jgi:hypothetical protein